MELVAAISQADGKADPDGWKTYTIGQSLTLINGRAFKPNEWKSHGIPIIRIQNLNDSRSPYNYCNSKVSKKYHVRAGDVLFAWSGTTGTSFGARIWGGPNAVLNQHIFKVIPDETKVTPYYAFLVLQKAQEDIEKQAHGFKASFVHVKKSDLVKVPLSIPGISEQQVIVEVLSDIDQLIATLERLITKKQAIKQGMMQELLTGKTRLPGFTEPWKAKRLGDIGSALRGVAYNPRADLSTGDRPFTLRLLRSNNVYHGNVVLDDLQFVHEHRVKPQQRLQMGDIVICMANGSRSLVGKSAYFDLSPTQPSYTFGAFMGVFRTLAHQGDARYIAQLLQGRMFRDWLDLILVGSSINNLRPRDVEDFVVSAPSVREQTEIANVLADADADIKGLLTRLAKEKSIKQGLMQELLTGRTRLPVATGAAS